MKYFLIYSIMLGSILFSLSDDFITNGLKQGSIDNYSSLTLESNDILEEPIDPNEYKVGAGDQFLFSMIYPSGIMNMKLDVSPLGEILIPLIGKINVNNLFLDDAFSLIKSRCIKKYENAEVNITLSKIRRFKVKVVGAVSNPGYKIASPIDRISDILNEILYRSSNLDDSLWVKDEANLHLNDNQLSSLRNITFIRGNDTTLIDLVKFNVIGDNNLNPKLENGDIIKVGYIKDYVGIYGAVHYEEEIEFIDNESLYDFITICGGFRTDADSSNISITRLNANNKKREDIVISSIQESKKFILQPNDHIYVRFNKDLNPHNLIKISGEINYPGFHSIKLGITTVKDIIETAGGYTDIADTSQIIINNHEIDLLVDRELNRINLIPPQYLSNLDHAYLKARTSISKGKISSGNTTFTEDIMDFKLTPGDEILIPKKFNYIEVIGGVIHPGRYPFVSKMSIERYVTLSGGETNESVGKIYIIKQSTGQRIKVRGDISLESGDIIFIPEKNDYDKFERVKDYVGIVYQVLISVLTIYNITN